MEKTTRSQDKELREMHRVLKSIASKLDRANFYEYMLYVQDKKRIMRVSFLSGIMRGLGGAIGFTLLGPWLYTFCRELPTVICQV